MRETESALREGQRNMLDGTAQAIADSLSQFPSEFLEAGTDGTYRESQIYGHTLLSAPLIDGYFDDWNLDEATMRSMRGADGDIRYVAGTDASFVYLLAEVRDNEIVYAQPNAVENADRIEIVSLNATGETDRLSFIPEAAGALIGRRATSDGPVDDGRLQGHWLETASGYRIEARIPRRLIGSYLGVTVFNTASRDSRPVRSATFTDRQPGRFVAVSPVLSSAIAPYAQSDLRLIVTDRAGWRLAMAGDIAVSGGPPAAGTGWMRLAYNALLEPGTEASFDGPSPLGRERQRYVANALSGEPDGAWFRSAETGRAVVAVAKPVWSGSVQTGAVVLQQGTAAILSLTNSALGRLLSLTLIATLGVATVLLGYATWLSLRIRRLSAAAVHAIDGPTGSKLPSAGAGDEIGDLSRSFADVLGQLRDYNDYLRTLASKLSHELRTPLTIVNSSLENLEHEALSPAAKQYTERAMDGAARLKKILDAMSDANRVEALMQNIDSEVFDLHAVVERAVSAYSDAWSARRFSFSSELEQAPLLGSPELIIQLLDKLIDNAIGFSADGDDISVELTRSRSDYELSIHNPGPPLPEKMRGQLFDSMVSVRRRNPDQHLGLGLHVARIVAEGHRGRIVARNVQDGVIFTVHLPPAE